MKHFGAVVLAIDMTNNALLPCQVMLLRHLLLNSLVCLHCLLIRLLRTGSSAHALHCAHSFICSYTCYGGYELDTLIFSAKKWVKRHVRFSIRPDDLLADNASMDKMKFFYRIKSQIFQNPHISPLIS